MNITSKQRLLIAFSSVLVGCAIGATLPGLAAQPFPPNTGAPRWEQFCDLSDSRNINNAVTSRGREGFELVTTNLDPAGNIFICFKRPAQ